MIKRIPLSALQVGMYITDLNNDWIPHNNEKRKGLIRREDTLERIAALGVTHVYIDTDKGLDSADGVPSEEIDRNNERILQGIAEMEPERAPKVDMAREMAHAQEVHSEAQGLIGQLMGDIKLGKAFDASPVNELAVQLQDSIFRNENALSCLGRIRHKDNYLLEHSINLSVLMSIFGRSRGFSEDVLHETIVGALLHDIGKILTPDEILHKPGRLTKEEFEIIKRHAADSRDILKATAGIGSLTLKTAAEHHERMDGSGYPEGLSADEISIYGRMAAVCDVYDAITADRVYHKGLPPTQGLKKLIEWSGDHLDPELVRHFIRCLGIYPIGSLVLLESGRLGVVIETNTEDQRLPVVRLMYHARLRQPITVETLDLSKPRVQDRIEKVVDPERYAIDVRTFLA